MTVRIVPSQSFCLIRHGETTANADEIIAGVTDVPLTDVGRAQARALADFPWPEHIVLHASPMSRAQQTAQLAFPDRPYQLHEGLRERNWGVFEGRSLCEQPAREDTPDQGESWPDMIERVRRTIIAICAGPQGVLPVLVCHSGVIRAVRVLWSTGNVGVRAPNAVPILFEKSDTEMTEKPL